eukprot:3475000-Prymnesium_polylepis.1
MAHLLSITALLTSTRIKLFTAREQRIHSSCHNYMRRVCPRVSIVRGRAGRMLSITHIGWYHMFLSQPADRPVSTLVRL